MKSITIDKLPVLEYVAEESINTLCTNLSFAGENVRRIMVTSSQSSEGKSFVTMNIMRKLADLGYSVVLVDADLRRSMLNRRYGIHFEQKDAPGLSHYLAGMAEIDDVVYATNIEGAYFVPVGHELDNSLALLNSSRLGDLLTHLGKNADYVLVDAPPIGTISDAAQISKSCDGSLFVVSYNRIRRRELVDVKNQIAATGCPILGTVLNMVEYDNFLGRKYYYKSYYSHYDRYYRRDENDTEGAK